MQGLTKRQIDMFLLGYGPELTPTMNRLYQSKTDEWWQGKRVVSKAPLRSDKVELPAGTVFRVIRKWGGFMLKSEKCPQCGVQVFFKRVPVSYVRLLVEEDQS